LVGHPFGLNLVETYCGASLDTPSPSGEPGFAGLSIRVRARVSCVGERRPS
jgi:hypothetical protein